MRMNGNRSMTVKKAELLKRIRENEKTHAAAYAKAVIIYKKEALKQLAELTKMAKSGNLTIKLNLTTPVDNRKNYKKIIDMFEMEIADEVVLSQDEYNEYVLDETEASRHALMSNSMYMANDVVLADIKPTRKARPKK